MKDNFKVHVYRDSNFRKGDYAFEWEGELGYDLIYGLDPKTKKPIYDNLFIRITDWSNFEDALDRSNITEYYPIVFWRHDSENNMFETGHSIILNKKPFTFIL